MTKNLVSIVIVNWNGKKWLKKCLDSLLDQSYKKVEIIIIDNASSDDSLEFIRENYPQVRLFVNKNNLGLTKAINQGVRLSKGEFLLLINNDAWVNTDFLERLYKFYSEYSFAVIAPQEKRYDKTQDFKCNTTIDPTGSPAYFIPTYGRPDKLFYLSVCFFCSRKAYLESKGLDNNFFMYHEDVDWFWRLSLLGKKFAYVDDVFIYHAGAGSTGGGIKYNTFLWRNQNALQTLIKNYSLQMLLLVLPIYFLQNLGEILFFLLTFKPRLAISYLQGWSFNIKNLRRTLKERKWIQERRVVNDIQILRKMYVGSGKLLLLKEYIK